jgi:hypothetical protein
VATAVGIATILIFVLAIVAMIVSNSLGGRLQSIFVLVIGLLLLGSSIAAAVAYGSWAWSGVGVGLGATALGTFFVWRGRSGPFYRPTRRLWVSWSGSIATVGLVLVLGIEFGSWSLLVFPAGLFVFIIRRVRRHKGKRPARA